MMYWKCAAIDHGVTVFPDGKIGPCCQIQSDYLKPIDELRNPHRFADLKTEYPPPACEKCIGDEEHNLPSYRNMFNQLEKTTTGLQFVDIRNINHCNLKCRYCGPHFSSSWAKELGEPTTRYQDIEQYKDVLITDDLHWMYFTGGEPLINPEHWTLLQELIDSNRAGNISLRYNTNLTTIKYKDVDIINLWSHFKSVEVLCSIDAIGDPLEYIRSGCEWAKIENNLQALLQSTNNSKITVKFTPVLSILNIWFIAELFDYAKKYHIPVNLTVLTGPDYLALDVIPDQLKEQALSQLDAIKQHLTSTMFEYISKLIQNNINNCLFNHTINHTLLLDNNRNEKLFNLLPFKEIARDQLLKNHEYEQR
jgi:sulfatase maturation enzyme AslB (radical SAM superfamily)